MSCAEEFNIQGGKNLKKVQKLLPKQKHIPVSHLASESTGQQIAVRTQENLEK